ncbi:hypothetical protein Tco_1477723, partial [Tanacetum coccineum]
MELKPLLDLQGRKRDHKRVYGNWDGNQRYNQGGCGRRGFSFIHALLGIALNELHLYGDPAAVSLIQRLLSVNGNNLRVQNYERLSPLIALKTLLDVLQTAELAIVLSHLYAIKYPKLKGVLTETTTALAASLSLTDSTRIVKADGFMRVDLYNGWLFHL